MEWTTKQSLDSLPDVVVVDGVAVVVAVVGVLTAVLLLFLLLQLFFVACCKLLLYWEHHEKQRRHCVFIVRSSLALSIPKHGYSVCAAEAERAIKLRS